MKMGKEILTFDDIEVEKNAAIQLLFFQTMYILKKYQYLTSFPLLKNYKCFNGYLYNDDKVKPLYKMLSKTRIYAKSYGGQTK